ncbi:hypothetical protein Q672_06665 [Marinobacter sp. EVN1]|uniref:hypothetical protein n=1 Tax=Marinobacter sp. EVN1 TaxID=1397532 RepID=UPI0003B863E7|nr:hypothetical protein [Marinobacter sp. EVN1]ERS82003.1 hypothetical protein Q672_06665 [Marinobacter sp. EVN1]
MKEMSQIARKMLWAPIGLYLLAFVLPGTVAPTGELIRGYDMTLQGGLLLLVTLANLGNDPWNLLLWLAPWLGNIVFLWGAFCFSRHGYVSAGLWALISLALISDFVISPMAIYRGSGEGAGTVGLAYGYFVWLAAPALLLLISIFAAKSRQHA